MTNTRNENLGYVYGLIAVTAFALTLPAMRAALSALDPVFVALGRGAGAAVLAAVFYGSLVSVYQHVKKPKA